MSREKAEVMDGKAMSRATARIAYEIIERGHGAENVCIVGIRRRGAVIAKQIADKIKEVEHREVPFGCIDITPYRDDLKLKNIEKGAPVALDFGVAGRTVVLVDDVLYTGRTVRAAIEAIMEQGRPKSLQLAVLIDRGHRELPISPDYVGKNVPTSRSETVEVHVDEFDGENRVVILESEGDC
jgi:pyrimidine operon attenuation protein / uracil phosphoribosyltransferase